MKLLIADSHPVVRKGLECLLRDVPNVEIVGSVDDGELIFDFVKSHDVDVILMEVNLPKLNGLTVLRRLREVYPDIKPIVFSSEPEDVYAISAIKRGAAGYLSKSADTKTILKALQKVSDGHIYLSDGLVQQLAFGTRSGGSDNRFYKKLSSRETEVLKLLTTGKKNKQISKELDINEKTVSTYKSRLMRKLKVDNLVDLVNRTKLSEQL